MLVGNSYFGVRAKAISLRLFQSSELKESMRGEIPFVAGLEGAGEVDLLLCNTNLLGFNAVRM